MSKGPGIELERGMVAASEGGSSPGKAARRPGTEGYNFRPSVRRTPQQGLVSPEPQWGWSLSDAVLLAAAIVLVAATVLFAETCDPPITTLVTTMDLDPIRATVRTL